MKAQIKVAVLVVNKKGELLLIKERLPNTEQAKWNTIKGTYENAGETIFEAAVRECLEEATVKVELTHALGIYLYGDEHEPRIQFNFLAAAKDDKIAVTDRYDQKLRSEDIIEVCWLKKQELTELKEIDYTSKIAYRIIQRWLKGGKRYPLEIYAQLQ